MVWLYNADNPVKILVCQNVVMYFNDKVLEKVKVDLKEVIVLLYSVQYLENVNIYKYYFYSYFPLFLPPLHEENTIFVLNLSSMLINLISFVIFQILHVCVMSVLTWSAKWNKWQDISISLIEYMALILSNRDTKNISASVAFFFGNRKIQFPNHSLVNTHIHLCSVMKNSTRHFGSSRRTRSRSVSVNSTEIPGATVSCSFSNTSNISKYCWMLDKID